MSQTASPAPGSSFFRHPVVQTVSCVVGAVFSAMVMIGATRQGIWILAGLFAIAEAWFVYALTSIAPRRDRRDRMTSFFNKRGPSQNARRPSGRTDTGWSLLQEFQAQEPRTARRRLRLSLGVGVGVAAALVVPGVALR